MNTWVRSRTAAFALGLCGVTGAAHGQVAASFPYDLPPSLVANDEVLPNGRDICLRLGLDPQVPGRCHALAVLAMSMRQTDRSLWFFKSTTGSGPGTYCPGALAFDRLKANGNIKYLCRAPEEDVAIRPDEIAALAAEASRLNALLHKTLAEHVRALELKMEIDCVTGRQVENCD